MCQFIVAMIPCKRSVKTGFSPADYQQGLGFLLRFQDFLRPNKERKQKKIFSKISVKRKEKIPSREKESSGQEKKSRISFGFRLEAK